MSKLFDLKEWLTIADAARYLSTVFGEEVQEADVLRLGLDGRLKLSVNFVNHARAMGGDVVTRDQVTWHESVLGANVDGKPILIPDCDQIDEHHWLKLSCEVTTLSGVWDLPMLGNEILDVEHAYQARTGGPEVTLQGLDGAFVEGADRLWQLQESFDDNPYHLGSKAQLQEIKAKIAAQNIDAEHAQSMLAKFDEQRKEFLKRQQLQPNHMNHYPAGGLPVDSVLVVRTTALRQLEDAVRGSPSKALSPTERNSLLTIVAALCAEYGIEHQERGVAAEITRLTEKIGAPVSHDTVKRALARIPDALDARSK